MAPVKELFHTFISVQLPSDNSTLIDWRRWRSALNTNNRKIMAHGRKSMNGIHERRVEDISLVLAGIKPGV